MNSPASPNPDPNPDPQEPAELVVETPDGRRTRPTASAAVLTELLSEMDLPLNTRCGQRGLCEGCLVELVRGRLHDHNGGAVEANGQSVMVRACQHRIDRSAPATVRVPMRSLLANQPQVLTRFRLNVPRAHDPLWQRIDLPEATEATTDLSPAAFAEAVARKRGGRWPVQPASPWPRDTATSAQAEAVLAFAGDHWSARPVTRDDPARALGAAIDVGTTTVVVMVVDLARGRVLGRASDTNHQARFGDNVLTRIQRCMNEPEAVTKLQQAVSDQTLRPLLERALARAEATANELVCVAIAGNTTMLHLLAGTDPSPLGTVPFEPAFLEHRVTTAAEVGLVARDTKQGHGQNGDGQTPGWREQTPVHLLPGAAAYVGADLMAGVLSSGLAYDDGPSLLVDVGTNGEIIARLNERLVGCATAAGPAFEGAGLAWGMRAGEGAIAHVRLTDDPIAVQIERIGEGPSVGICGSAYIDLVAEGRRTGLIDACGRIDTARARVAGLHVDSACSGAALRLDHNADGQPILITEADIAALMQAKAAIAAGIVTLLDRLGMGPADVHRLYLAGGFGMNVDIEHAIACGLLPGFRREQVQLVGNTSLAGAYLALLDAGALTELGRIARDVEMVELNLDPEFEMRFIEHLMLGAANEAARMR
ncbi:MAG: ASKHA domain-containing protein [Phycisphaeraceae bacterium]